MNDKNIMLDKNGEQNEVTPVSHRKVLVSLLAAVICLLLAALVWVCVMNTQDTDYIPIRVIAPAEYECELSVDGVEVEGTVATLRTLKEIAVTVSAEDAAYVVYLGGEALMPEAMLQLPDGVHLTRDWSAVLTVTKK